MTTYNVPPQQPTLIETLCALAQGNLVLLGSVNTNDKASINPKSYVDVMFMIADIINVSRLALENNTASEDLKERNASISRLLGIVLDLIPYEEADLLDWFRESFLINKERYEIPIENFILTKPVCLA